MVTCKLTKPAKASHTAYNPVENALKEEDHPQVFLRIRRGVSHHWFTAGVLSHVVNQLDLSKVVSCCFQLGLQQWLLGIDTQNVPLPGRHFLPQTQYQCACVAWVMC
ncbi:hypothetical protein BaRGS_00014225 [Batillaria attramentaria]|uniref:Uncharacterized protein n=1 Tax=Batillaria attramentaria TaxID=370345 RepID=A0ABD0L5G5_9CAEN